MCRSQSFVFLKTNAYIIDKSTLDSKNNEQNRGRSQRGEDGVLTPPTPKKFVLKQNNNISINFRTFFKMDPPTKMKS